MPIIGGFEFDENAFREALENVKEKLGEHIKELCNTTVELAKDASPYDTGNNRKSITADYTLGGGAKIKHLGEMSAAGGKEGFSLREKDMGFRVYTQSGYGGWLELGTKRMPARPYIYTGFMQAVNDIASDLEGAV